MNIVSVSQYTRYVKYGANMKFSICVYNLNLAENNLSRYFCVKL